MIAIFYLPIYLLYPGFLNSIYAVYLVIAVLLELGNL